MPPSLVIAAQLSSQLAPKDRGQLDRVVERAHRAAAAAGIDVLIAGGAEIPELFQALTGPSRAARQVYLWYAALSDYPRMLPEHRVVSFRGNPSSGWQGSESWQEVGESFVFACPNNPAARSATVAALEQQLAAYAFDGVFLDKIRFPSPANGWEELCTCFCPHCRAAAAQQGLPLTEVQHLLARMPGLTWEKAQPAARLPQAGWLAALISGLDEAEQTLLLRFLRFRAQSITRLVEDIQAMTRRRGVRLALDLFSPGLAYLVGQDYPALAGLADWIKPMSYRYANGPAGLRLEIPQFVRGLERYLQLKPGAAQLWMKAHIPGFEDADLNALDQAGAPLALIAQETRQAVAWMGAVPVYMGVEAVSIPAFQIDIQPAQVRQMISIARDTGARGIVLAWDLLQMPLKNLQAVGE